MRRLARTVVLVTAALMMLTAGPAVAGPVGGGGGGPEEPEDLSEPRIVVTPDRPAHWEGWYGDTVNVHLQAFDDQGEFDLGLDFVEYELKNASAGVGRIDNDHGTTLTITNGGVTVIEIAAFDTSGNIGRLTYNIGIDRVAPTVTYGGRLTGDRVFFQGEKVSADYTCGDVGTEVASCVGPVPAGTDLNTSIVGTHVVNVEAVDRVGNTSRVPLTYHVFPQTFTTETRTAIHGNPVVGETLTATPATFSPTPTSSGVRWYRGGTEVASGTSYQVTAADLGSSITAVTTANRTGWPEGSSSSDAVTGRAGTIQVSYEPTLEGEAVVGSGLWLWQFPAPTLTPSSATIQYAWYRDGELLDTSTSGSPQYFGLTAADLGHRISVTATVSAPGYTTRTWNLGPSAPVAGRPLEVVGRPTVTGVRRVGSVLTAKAPVIREFPVSRAPGDPARLAYQWLRDGRAIPRATGRSYRLTVADAGRRISVRVTGTATGHAPAVVTSSAGGPVAKATPVLRATVGALGRGKARLRVIVTAPGTPVAGSVTVRRGNRVVLRRSLRAGALTAVLSRQPRGRVTYTVVYGGSGGVVARAVRVTARLR